MTSSYSSRFLRMSKLRSSTFFWAPSMRRDTMRLSMAWPSSMPILVVHDLVVFEQVLADVEVALLDLLLGPLDAPRHHAALDGLAVLHAHLGRPGPRRIRAGSCGCRSCAPRPSSGPPRCAATPCGSRWPGRPPCPSW